MKQLKKRPTKQLEKFSTLFTQLGLVLVLFIVYVTIEYETEQQQLAVVDFESPTRIVVEPDQEIIFTKEPKKEPKVEQPSSTFIPDEPVKKAENNAIETPFIDDPEPTKEVNVEDIVELKEPPKDEDDKEFLILNIQNAPVFKGCEGLSPAENKICFDKQMNKFIQRNFDKDLASDLGLHSGVHKIYTQFIIDKNGDVVDIKIRAPHPKLKSETLETIQKLPKFKPGKQNNREVKVRYTLPILFKVD